MEIYNNLIQWTEEWKKVRAWVLTWSKVSAAISGKKDTRLNLIYDLISQKIAPIQEWYKSDAMKMGNIKEEVFKEIYHEPIKEVGFIKKKPWLWLSPDWVDYNEKWDIIQWYEIKSPEPKTFTKYLIEDKIPKEYYPQALMYFAVIDTLEDLQFIIFNPDIYDSNFRIKILNMKRSDYTEEIEDFINKINAFRKEWVEVIWTLKNLAIEEKKINS